ncbi:MAG: hypothetical protein GY866_20460 [Proteobacteria bacterium]|nr:hypothetical protein [Pseudomonadota bacterium]
MRARIEDDDTEALSVLERLQPLIPGGEISVLLKSVEDVLNSYDFEEALERLQKVEEKRKEDNLYKP